MEGTEQRLAVQGTYDVLVARRAKLVAELSDVDAALRALGGLLSSPEFDGGDMDGEEAITIAQIKRWGSLSKSLKGLACDGDGRLHLGPAVTLVHRAGVSTSKRRGNIRSMAVRVIKRDPNWVEDGDDWYVYRPCLPEESQPGTGGSVPSDSYAELRPASGGDGVGAGPGLSGGGSTDVGVTVDDDGSSLSAHTPV